jgi:hypothetical protein
MIGRDCATSPRGVAAKTTHCGDVGRLGEASAVILAWCRANERLPAGPSWEVYGHWHSEGALTMTRLVGRRLPTAGLAAFLLCALGTCLAVMASPQVSGQTPLNAFVGTWTGTSTCVGDRPACKDETVVYRFVPLGDRPQQLRVLADKIIDGKRLPMGALVFAYDAGKGELRSEFTISRTHGIWTYSVAGDSLTGTLIVLPERSVARDVKAHRVKDSDLPAAPAISEYGD